MYVCVRMRWNEKCTSECYSEGDAHEANVIQLNTKPLLSQLINGIVVFGILISINIYYYHISYICSIRVYIYKRFFRFIIWMAHHYMV